MSLEQLTFDKHNTATCFLKGNAGDIEAVITRPDSFTETTPVMIISHPHPLYGGSMSNKVVHILAKTFTELNAITLRYNFRGVGQSAGEYDHGAGESDDLLMIVNSIKHWRPLSPIWLAGFSFGAYVTARAQAAVQAEKLLLVAPPVDMYRFDGIDEFRCPWWVIQGGQDEVIDAQGVKKWLAQRKPAPKLIWLQDAGHFFHGKLIEVKTALLESW